MNLARTIIILGSIIFLPTAESAQPKMLDGYYFPKDYIEALRNSGSPHYASDNTHTGLIAEIAHKAGLLSISFGNFREGIGKLEFDQEGTIVSHNPFEKFIYRNEKEFSLLIGGNETQFSWVGKIEDFFRKYTLAGSYIDQNGQPHTFGISGEALFMGQPIQYSVQADPDNSGFDAFFIEKGGRIETQYGYKMKADRLDIYKVTNPLSYDAQIQEPPILILKRKNTSTVKGESGRTETRLVLNFDRLVDLLYRGKSTVELAKEGKTMDGYLRSLSSEQIKILRNAIFAGKGYKFDTPSLSQYFLNKYSDYKPVSKKVTTTEWERRNIEYLSSIEKDARSSGNTR